jgi:hypothetical protein
MTDESRLPPALEALDRALGAVRFEPRGSLGAEILGRVRRGEAPAPGPRRPHRILRPALAAAAVLMLALGAALAMRRTEPVTVDRCCYDLDGGGAADDGIRVVAERDGAVHRLQVYEDRDGSRGLSSGDFVRLDRGGAPAMRSDSPDGLVTTRHCCVDLDGGGPADDELLVIGVPPDRVVMAAIYERRTDPWRGRQPASLQLR